MVSRKPPPPPTQKRPAAAAARTSPGPSSSPPRSRSTSGRGGSGKALPRPISESFSGLTLPDVAGPDFQDEITLPRRNPYALPPKGRAEMPSDPGALPYATTASEPRTGGEARTTPSSPGANRIRGQVEGQTKVDLEPPQGVQTERNADKVFDELYDAVNTEVTRTELLWGLTQFAKRRLQTFRQQRDTRRKTALRHRDGSKPSRARPVGAALAQYVSMFGVPVRLWIPATTVMVLSLAAAVAAIVLGAPAPALPSSRAAVRPSAPLPAPLPSTLSSVMQHSEVAPAPEPVASASLADRAAAGDKEAVAELEARPLGKRTAEETVALEHARIAKHLASLEELRAQFDAQPSLVSDPEWMNTLRAFVTFERTSAEALLVAAGLPGEAGPDFLYDVWTRTGKSGSTTRLAKQLLYASDVRAHASEALAVTLDLHELADQKKPDACEEILDVLERARKEGDSRALRPIRALGIRTGCGKNEKQDCYPCLRGNPLLARAKRGARRREAPTP